MKELENIENLERENLEKHDGPVVFSSVDYLKRIASRFESIYPEYTEQFHGLVEGFDTLGQEIGFDTETPRVISHPAGNDEATENLMTIEKEDLKSWYFDLLNDFYQQMKTVAAGYNEKGQETQKKLANLFLNDLKMIASPDYFDKSLENADYLRTFNNIAKNMPCASFKDGEGYKNDINRFNNLMYKYGILDAYADKQDFYMNHFLPNKELREKGFISEEDAVKYNEDYRQHLKNQEKYYKKMVTLYNSQDPDIAQNEVLTYEVDFFKQIAGKNSLPVVGLKRIEDEIDYLDRGWPAADMIFLRQVDQMKKNMENYLKNKKGAYRKEVEETLKIMEVPYYTLKNSYVSSESVRKELLEGMEKSVKAYSDVMDKLDKYSFRVDTHKIAGEQSIIKCYQDTLNRNVSSGEIGVNPVYIKNITRKQANLKYDAVKRPNEKPFNEVESPVIAGFDFKQIERNLKIMLADLNKVDPSWMKSSEQFANMKTELKELMVFTHQANERIYDSFNLKDDYLKYLREFNERADHLKETVGAYIDHKDTEIRTNDGRKNKWIKQFREQPRIRMALGLYDKLGFMVDHSDPQVIIQPYRDNLKERVDTKLAAIKQDMSAPDINKEQYILCAGKALIYHRMTRDSYFKPINESEDQFLDRIKNSGKRDFTMQDVDKACETNAVVKKVIDDIRKNIDNPDYKKPTVEELIETYDKAVKKQAKIKDVKASSKERNKNIKEYKDRMTSDKNKQKEAEKKQARKNPGKK